MELQEFRVPLHAEDLLNSDGETYVVDDAIVDISSLENTLNDVVDLLVNAQPSSIYSNEIFDPIFCLMRKFSELDDMLKSRLFDLLLSSLSNLVDAIQNFLAAAQFDEENFNQDQKVFRNALKMYCFLMQWFFSLCERAELDINGSGKGDDNNNNNSNSNSKKKKKGSNSNNNGFATSEEYLQEEWSWSSNKGRILAILSDVMDLDLGKLWSMSNPEPEFLNLFERCAYSLFENPTSIKEKQLRNDAVKILGKCLKKFNFTGVQSFIRLLQNYEQSAVFLAELTQTLALEFESTLFVESVLKEIFEMINDDSANSATGASAGKETGSTKNAGIFLQELTERIPLHVLNQIGLLIPHLANDSFSLRSGVISSIGFILISMSKMSVQQLNGNKEIMEIRQNLLSILTDRFQDCNSFTRSRCIQTWLSLVTEKAVPVKYLPKVSLFAYRRLHDKAMLPRKSAIQLLNLLLQYNPYSPELKLSTFEDQLVIAKKELDSISATASTTTTETLVISNDENSTDSSSSTTLPTNSISEVEKLKMTVSFLEEAISFIKNIEDSLLAINDILASKTSSDVVEAIEFLVTADTFKIKTAKNGVRKMMFLIFSKENGIREAVISACQRLYLTPPSNLGTGATAESQQARALFVAMNLINALKDANPSEMTCFEELLGVLKEKNFINATIVKTLCDIFAGKFVGLTDSHIRGAIWVLSLLASFDPEIVSSRISLFVSQGLSSTKAKKDSKMFLFTCSSLEKMGKREKGVKESPQRYPVTHDMFIAMQNRMIGFNNYTAATTSSVASVTSSISHDTDAGNGNEYDNITWFTVMESVINTVFALCSQPELFFETTIKYFSEQVDSLPSPINLSKLLFILGHVGLKELVHIENIQLDRKYKRMRADENALSTKKSTSESTNATNTSSTTATNSKGGGSKKKTSVSSSEDKKEKDNDNGKEKESIEQELGVGTALQDDTEAEILNEICDKNLVSGNKNLLAVYAPLVIKIVSNTDNKFTDAGLRITAVLTLCKFMIVSSDFCEQYLQLLFTVLAKAPEEAVRCNIVIALGDLAFRHPNLVEPYTTHLYTRLRDVSPRVRKNTLMVLTHLILNDMIKLRGQICEMAVCMEDEEDRIRDLAHLFFHELSRKGNAIYNILPDAISTLSYAATNGGSNSGVATVAQTSVTDKNIINHGNGKSRISDEAFHNIMKYLFTFIDKDKQMEGLLEKLCNRFLTFDSHQQWRHLAFCLNLLSHNERSVKKLQDSFSCYCEMLHDDEVFNAFVQILGKCKKFAKQETKTSADELEARMIECRNKQLEDIEAADAAAILRDPEALREKQRLVRQKHFASKQQQLQQQQQEGEVEEGQNQDKKEKQDADEEDDDIKCDDEDDDEDELAAEREKKKETEIKKEKEVSNFSNTKSKLPTTKSTIATAKSTSSRNSNNRNSNESSGSKKNSKNVFENVDDKDDDDDIAEDDVEDDEDEIENEKNSKSKSKSVVTQKIAKSSSTIKSSGNNNNNKISSATITAATTTKKATTGRLRS